MHQSFINPYIARELPVLFIQHGLQDIKIIPKTSTVRSFEIVNKIFQFTALVSSYSGG